MRGVGLTDPPHAPVPLNIAKKCQNLCSEFRTLNEQQLPLKARVYSYFNVPFLHIFDRFFIQKGTNFENYLNNRRLVRLKVHAI